jgi:hypothetical protein
MGDKQRQAGGLWGSLRVKDGDACSTLQIKAWLAIGMGRWHRELVVAKGRIILAWTVFKLRVGISAGVARVRAIHEGPFVGDCLRGYLRGIVRGA